MTQFNSQRTSPGQDQQCQPITTSVPVSSRVERDESWTRIQEVASASESSRDFMDALFLLAKASARAASDPLEFRLSPITYGLDSSDEEEENDSHPPYKAPRMEQLPVNTSEDKASEEPKAMAENQPEEQLATPPEPEPASTQLKFIADQEKNLGHMPTGPGVKNIVCPTTLDGYVTDAKRIKELGCQQKFFHIYRDNGPVTCWVAFKRQDDQHTITILTPWKNEILIQSCLSKIVEVKNQGHHITWTDDKGAYLLKCYKGGQPDENLQRPDNITAENLTKYISLLRSIDLRT